MQPPSPSPTTSQSASLIKRLAGPSTGKAGLATDQTEINRIIAEASKGSQFYENEKRKDKDLTDRIMRILKQRDEVCRGVDLGKVEKTVDQIVQLESKRDLSQVIVHVDMDAFFANVEVLYNPDLTGKPFGVGHGVLSTASYEARKYGVRSGMPAFIAKKLCPELIIVSTSGSRYMEVSGRVMAILRRYDPEMAPAGCDEGYLNITQYCNEHESKPEDCVREIRATVLAETKLTISAGIAPNKICSDKNKPNGQFMLPFNRGAILDFMRQLPIRKVHGIGRVNERLLESIGIRTCEDIHAHRAVLQLMDKQFGLHFLLRIYLGISSNVVKPHQREERKSIGAERTFHPIHDQQLLLKKLEEIAGALENDMAEDGWSARTITLKFKLDTFQVFTRAKSCDHWIVSKEDIFSIGKELLQPEFPLSLRLLGLRATKLKDLRASESKGIKRFFNSAQDSARKRLKTLDDGYENTGTEAEAQEASAGDFLDDSMPGFHEHDEADDILSQQRWEGHSEDQIEADPSTAETDQAESLSCPICFRTLQTDNSGLNAHIDFCLSRQEILKVQIEASQATRSVPRSHAASRKKGKHKA
ncbi:DNA/RNA polymerase [Pluteus cervinus]|uniref:DNA/RNA polymerase n=1 Tax=Pluteus cervinus TaxID=181527 RepID=A0ACD3ASS3_9AGAR|nr:DNA/RNA polymerase [Pluteus cervinus]